MPNFIASCAKGMEYLLLDELNELGAKQAHEGLSQVAFQADWKTLYQILVWSRVASRVFYPLATFTAENDAQLYEQASIIDWSQHINPAATFIVHSQSYKSSLSHTQFISQRIKDAVVDYFKDAQQSRPEVAFEQADVVLHCRIRRNKVVLSVDLAGAGLHHRGYRTQGGAAPLKENLAASLLLRAGWKKHQHYPVLFDPMCGSGTLLIEGAMIAMDIAPGLNRQYLGLFGWPQFDKNLWQQVIQQAEQRKQQGMASNQVIFCGSDSNPHAVRNAQANVARASLEQQIKIYIAAIDQIDHTDSSAQFNFAKKGLLIVNPPYSERLGEKEATKKLYVQLGQVLRAQFVGWRASVLSAHKELGHALAVRAHKIYKFNNGSIPCELLNFQLEENKFLKLTAADQLEKDFKQKISDQAQQLLNRIEKNQRKLKRFLQQENISCYRIYDADLPDYNAAIDVYKNQQDGKDYLHIQEYKAPKSIDSQLAMRRLKEIQRVSAGVYQIPRDNAFIKQRQQQKGNWQYQSTDKQNTTNWQDKHFVVEEGGHRFWVNLTDYLDTGLFVDHRKVRRLIAEKSAGKHLLNLFCYTASASVYAAKAGALSTTNVDMSRSYLHWAEKNFQLNAIDLNKNLNKHEFIREDCLQWLEDALKKQLTFEVIFLDPPTFSNSKKMQTHLDIQKDYIALIDQCLQLLPSGGELIFSNNFQKFHMDLNGNEFFTIKEITRQTTSLDFGKRNLHRCWLISKQ